MDENCGIYCIENIVNGKKYIGQSKGIRRRWYIHKRLLNNKQHFNVYLQNSYDKYGVDNFNFYIIELCEVEELHKKELKYMSEYNATDRKFGYNLRASTEHGVKFSEELLQKMRESSNPPNPVYQINLNGEIIKKWEYGCSQASTELKYSQSHILKCCQKKKWNITYKNYIWVYCSEYDNGDFDLNYYLKRAINRKVVQLSKSLDYIKTWDSANEASKFLNIQVQNIRSNCRHANAYTGDFVFEYLINYQNGDTNPNRPKINKEVVQLSKDGEFIKVWHSAHEASKEVVFGDVVKCVNSHYIKCCCEGKYEHHYGYRWMYLEDYNKINNKYAG